MVVPKEMAFNKMGHAMHDLNPLFEQFSYSSVMKNLIFDVMKYEKPLIV